MGMFEDDEELKALEAEQQSAQRTKGYLGASQAHTSCFTAARRVRPRRVKC